MMTWDFLPLWLRDMQVGLHITVLHSDCSVLLLLQPYDKLFRGMNCCPAAVADTEEAEEEGNFRFPTRRRASTLTRRV